MSILTKKPDKQKPARIKSTYSLSYKLDQRIREIFRKKYHILTGNPRGLSRTKLIEKFFEDWCSKEEETTICTQK